MCSGKKIIATAALGPVGYLAVDNEENAERSANAQQGIATAQLAEQRRTRDLAVAAANSPQEIKQLEQAIQLNTEDVDRKRRLLASADPAIIAAGENALALLNGKDAAILSPLRNQRAKERKALEAKLRSQLGSGYANTTAGIQALSAFDEASGNTLATAQNQSLGQLLGTVQGVSSAGLSSNIQNSGTLAQLFGNVANRNVSAINQTPISAVGAEFAGDLARSQQAIAQNNQYLQLGASLLGAAAGGGGGAPTAGKVT